MNEDPTSIHVRRELVAAAVERANVAIHSTHDDAECVAVGKVVKVSRSHAIVQVSRSGEPAAVPLAAITKIERLDESKSTTVENIETPPDAA